MGVSEDNVSLTLSVNFSNFDSPLRKQIFRVPGVGKEIGFMARTLTGDRQTDRQTRDEQMEQQGQTNRHTESNRDKDRWTNRKAIK